MRKNYLLLITLLIMFRQGVAQQMETIASARRYTPQLVHESLSLKENLQKVERIFKISIAYKDEWIDGKTSESNVLRFGSAEAALRELLDGTDLSFRKAGDSFYVITQQIIEAKATNENSTIAPFDVSADFYASVSDLNRITPVSSYFFSHYDITITGTVKDENDQPFPGVNVVVKGTTNGTSTDAEGKYTISVPNANSVLVFSFVGYSPKEVSVGNQTVIDVSMVADIQSLNEVVVTALGIEKSTKSLGYATAKVNSDALTINRTPNFMNSLQGKVAGVNVTSLGTGPAGTSKIRIRGQSTLVGTNGPLIVVNGVPIDNTNFGTNSGNIASDNSIQVRGGGVTADGGDGLSSINPDDIESMTVLKGGPAAALYGSRAKDGVIMITTKSKGETKGLGVTYNLNYTNENPLDFTDYQYEYGQGENGVRPTAPNPTSGQWSFGERFQPGMTQILFDGVEVPYVPQRDRIKKFFRNGQNVTNTVSIAANTDKGGFNLSLANMESKGIVPNNSYNRRTINLGYSFDLSKKLSLRGNINYSNEFNKNVPNVGQQDNTIPVAVFNMSNSMPFDLLNEKKYNAAGNEFVYSRFMNRTNPYWVLAEQFNNIRRDRLFGNITLRYNLLSWLFIQGRIGQDFWTRDQDYNNYPTGQASRPAAQAGFVNGVYTQEARRQREANYDFLVGATKTFGDFGVDANFGGNQLRRRADLNSVQVTDFVVRGLYTVQNGRAKDPFYALAESQVNSLYGSAEFNYKEFIYLSGTLRNDWFSTLSPSQRSISYPSVTASYVISESTESLPAWVSFAKVRAGYSEVGSDGDVGPYANALYYGVGANLFANQPVGFSNGNTLPNANLRPARVAETEVGLDLRLFQNKLGVDLSLYRKLTQDQILQAQISDASGFVDTRINSGRSENRGVELMVNIVPVETSDFKWNFNFNGAYNISKVLSLLTERPGERFTTGTHVFNGELRQVVGEEMNQIAGFGYRRDANGNKIFGANGLPLRTQDLILFGSALHKWIGGFTNTLNYKGINLSFLIDFKLGGKMLSGTNFNAIRHGLHKMTLEGREGGVVGVGVTETGEVNQTVAPVQQYWEVVRSQALVEPAVYNAGFWKLRQLSLGYDFTKFLKPNLPIRGLRLDIVSNNVLMIKKWVPNIDPEAASWVSDNLNGLESTSLPTTRSVGFNLNVKF